jgi:hypothetical protein
MRKTLIGILFVMSFGTAVANPSRVLARQRAQPGAAVADWHELVDHMAGPWTMTGDVLGKSAHHTVRAEWVLDRQFLRIEEKTSSDAPADERRYDSIWFLGYDDVSDRYVMHLMDTFGGRFSETLGYATRDGNTLRFVFEYPDGPFHTDFTWDPGKQQWTWLMQQKDKEGAWKPFAHLTLAKSAAK